MYTSLYEDGYNNADSPLIMGLVDQALASRPELTMIAYFMRDGCAMMILLTGHSATWYINWDVGDPNKLDTGLTFLSLADPEFNNKLVDQVDKIANAMAYACVCHRCQGGSE